MATADRPHQRGLARAVREVQAAPAAAQEIKEHAGVRLRSYVEWRDAAHVARDDIRTTVHKRRRSGQLARQARLVQRCEALLVSRFKSSDATELYNNSDALRAT